MIHMVKFNFYKTFNYGLKIFLFLNIFLFASSQAMSKEKITHQIGSVQQKEIDSHADSNSWYGYQCVAINPPSNLEAKIYINTNKDAWKAKQNGLVKMITKGKDANVMLAFKTGDREIYFDKVGMSSRGVVLMFRGDDNGKFYSVFVNGLPGSSSWASEQLLAVGDLDENGNPIPDAYINYEAKCYSRTFNSSTEAEANIL
jgi:hypothetical protein